MSEQDRITHDDIHRDLLAGGQRFDKIEHQLCGILERLEPLPQMRKDLAETREIVEAWSTAKNLARFIKWASGIAAAIGVLWAMAKVAAKGWL